MRYLACTLNSLFRHGAPRVVRLENDRLLAGSDVNDGGAACKAAPINWSGAGGTSFASPIMAGIQAVVNQHKAARQGNPNPVYYKLTAAEYGTKGDANCNSSLGKSVSSACIFYDTTSGDVDVPCYSSYSCYDPSRAND